MGDGAREFPGTANLLPVLGFAVFVRLDDTSFQLAGGAPKWLRGFRRDTAGPLTSEALTETFPYLEVFLADAEEHWGARRPDRLASEIWTQTDAAGKEWRLRAAAICAEDRALLLIEPAEVLFNETQGFVQHAHDVTLAYDKVAKLSRALAAANEELDIRNREVERATRAKSEFLARMSHEIRTPMNAILGMADLLWETPLGPEQREYVRVFRRAGDNLLNLINDILDLSKVEAGQMVLEQSDFNLYEVLEKAVEVAAVRAHAKGLELSCRIGADVPAELSGDAGRLRQIVLNLLGNSIKFTGRGELTVGVDRDPGGSAPGALRFCVRDTGIGIAPDKIGAIFESFTQADSSIHGKYGGTGLGLSISKSFAELMGGRMWVESTLGAGSAFYFTAVFRARNVPSAIPQDFAGLRCLVAGGNANHRAAVIDILTAWGALAVDSDGLDLVENVDRARRSGEPYSLVLVDAGIPGADSFHLAQLVRESNSSTQVLLMLRTDRPADAARCRQLGLRSLLKPVRRAELSEIRRAGAPVETSQQAGQAEPEFSSTRILLADDSEDNRFLIRSYLKNSGCLLDEAADGFAALEKFKVSAYQLVLTDVEMPAMDGYTATRQMRQWERENGRRPTPILALTAHALAGEAQKSADAGCNAHLTKPIQKAVLIEAIRRHALQDGSPASPTRTVVDVSLRDIVPGYLANRRADVIALGAALEKGDFAAIRMAAHKIKGTGGGYGFPVLTELGGAIEAAALSQDGDSVRKSLSEMDRYLQEVVVEYQEEGGGG